MNKRILSLLALLIASATLFSACTATFALQIPEYTGDDKEREDFPFSDLVPPDYSGDWGVSVDASGSGDLPFSPDVSPDVPSPDPVSPSPTDPSPDDQTPSILEQLAALLGQNFGSLEQVEGFYGDYNYFVADFTKGKAEYHHMGKQLYVQSDRFSQSELGQIAQMLSVDNLVMMEMTKTASGQIVQKYTVHGMEQYTNEDGIFSLLALVYYDENNNKQAFSVFEHLCALDEDGKIPGVDLPTEDKMPADYYTPQWFSWLKRDDGKTIQKVEGVKMGSYRYQEGYDPSPFLPHGGSNTTTPDLSPYKGGKLLLHLYMDRDEFYCGKITAGFIQLQHDYLYQWHVFYRKQGSNTSYKSVSLFPTTAGGNGMNCLYRLDVLDAGMELQLNADGSPGVYEMIVVFSEKKATGKIAAWFESEITWSNASIAYQDLATYGYVREENKLPEVPPVEEMPDTYYTEEWFDWLKKDDGKTFQKVEGVKMGSYKYKTGYDPSPFLPYGGTNTTNPELSLYMGGKLMLHLYMDQDEFYCTKDTTRSGILPSQQQINFDCKWYIFYREKESSAPYKQISLHPTTAGGNGKNCLYRLDVLGEGMALQLKSDGSPGVYEMLVVFASAYDNERVVAWFEEELIWSNASIAHQDLATYGYVREENKLPEVPPVEEMPEAYYTEEWFTWLKNDAGRTLKKIQGVKMGSYSYKEDYDASPFFPYGGNEAGAVNNLSPYKGGKLLLHLYMDRDEFYCGKDASPNLSNETYCRWTIFYREKGSDTPYQQSITAFPVTAGGPGTACLYRLNVLGSGMKLQLKEDGSPTVYEILVVFTEMSTGTLAAWFEEELIWSNSSVAYQDLTIYGYVRDINMIPSDTDLPPVHRVPQLSFTQEWIEWVKNDNGATLQKVQSVRMGSYRYLTGYDPSPFLPYGGTNTENPELSLYMGGKLMLLLYMDRDEFFAGKKTYWDPQKEQTGYDHDYVWSIFYREKGSDDPYTQLNLYPTTSGGNGKNCVYRLDVLSAGMELELSADGSPGVYEMLVVFTDEDTEIPAAWFESEITWTNSSIAYQDLATYGYVREENQL